MDLDEAINIIEKKYGLKRKLGTYIMPLFFKNNEEPEDFKKAANYLFNELDYCFEYEEVEA